MSEIEPVELSEPVDVVAWLRALPVGAVLLDKDGMAWQLHVLGRGPGRLSTDPDRTAFHCAVDGSPPRWRAVDEDMRQMARWAPFRVLWPLPPGGVA